MFLESVDACHTDGCTFGVPSDDRVEIWGSEDGLEFVEKCGVMGFVYRVLCVKHSKRGNT